MSQDPLIGRHLANFRIERLLGRGGMGKVYYGQDVKLLRPVAIKLISTAYQSSPSSAARFSNEARAIATWNHEHIPQVYYADDEDGLYYFVMEYIDGQDLGALLTSLTKQGELLPHPEVLRIGRAVASALDYAHAKGVIHRDVKPANVMLEKGGRVLLMDFGLALDTAQGTRGEVFGSAQYMAPEQARSSANAVPQSDTYALGVMLYELLTGVVPFDDPSPTSVAIQHLTAPPPRPRTINPALSEAAEEVLLKALSKAPAERYQSATALLDALEPALAAPLQPAIQPAPQRRALGTKPLTLESAEAAPPRDPLLGAMLGAYEVEALVGRGGMARIYRGHDTRLGRPVAIKIIDTPFQHDADYTLRFKREAQAIAQLEHPTIVRLYDYGDFNGLLYMVMEFVAGETLQAVIMRHAASQQLLPLDRVVRLARDVCAALDYAHRKGIIHRDVKPGNILIDESGQAILADFGLALLTSEGTRGEVFGTPHYIAPEQAMSSAGAVPQSDLYAVGVMLYELVAGQLPFDSPDPLDIALLHMSEPARPIHELRPDIAPALEDVIMKALAKEPRYRYQTGAELVAALEQALQGALPAAPPPAPNVIAQPVRRQLEQRQPQVAGPAPAPQLAQPPAPAPTPPIGQQPRGREPSPARTQPGAALPARTSPLSPLANVPRPALLAGLVVVGVLLAFFVFRGTGEDQLKGGLGSGSGPTSYVLRIVKQGDESATITNISQAPFPLGPLQIGEGQRAVRGTAWDVELIEPNACVVARKEKKKDDAQVGGCTNVSATLDLPNQQLFWTSTFDVYYDGEILATCVKEEARCQFAITVDAE